MVFVMKDQLMREALPSPSLLHARVDKGLITYVQYETKIDEKYISEIIANDKLINMTSFSLRALSSNWQL